MIRKSLIYSALLTCFTGAAYAQPPASNVTAGFEPSYFQGNFGTGQNIRIWYLPAYVQFKGQNARIKLTVPYLVVQSKGALVSGGTVVGKNTSNQTTTHSGLGDIWLSGHYTLRGNGRTPDLVPYAKIKFGTASRSEGLGTGENDYELGTGLDWTVGTAVFPFAHVGYRWVGSPPGITLRNIATYDAGSTFAVGNQNYLTLMFAGHQSEQAGFPSAADAIVAWNLGSGFQVYFDKGLSNGSPNYGVGVGGQVNF